MPFAKRKAAIVARRPVTQNPKFVRLQARVANLAKRGRHHAAKNENTLLVLGGAALPALVQRFSGRGLPTFAGIDPGILWGAALMGISTQVGGKNGERLMAIGTGVAAPAIARAVTTGTIKVSGDDDVGADDEISGDDDVGAEEII
jgi:hypothetical protein